MDVSIDILNNCIEYRQEQQTKLRNRFDSTTREMQGLLKDMVTLDDEIKELQAAVARLSKEE